MKKVFIIHGFGGIPNGGWFPWLMKELALRNIFTCSLPMPNTDNPVVSEWVSTIEHNIGNPSDEIILLGHSLGVAAVLRYLESLKEGQRIGAAILVSGFSEPLEANNSESEYRKIDEFVLPKINFTKIKNSAKFYVLHGDKDNIVPLAQAEIISKALDCKLITIKNGDHFSQKTKPICYELPETLQTLKEFLNIT